MGKRLLRLYDIAESRIDAKERELLDDGGKLETLQLRRNQEKMKNLKVFCNQVDELVDDGAFEELTIDVEEHSGAVNFTFDCFFLSEHEDEIALREMFTLAEGFSVTPNKDGSMHWVFKFPCVWDFLF